MKVPLPTRRAACCWPLAALWPLSVAADEAAAQALRSGGVVLAMRHSLAPGTFDPPGFRLDDCSTQRNLSDEGRAQARALGQWLRERALVPRAVRSSPWCRCLETARLAFGRVEAWPALSSPRTAPQERLVGTLPQLREALDGARGRPGFEAWVTHNFVLDALARTQTSSGEGLVLRAPRAGEVEIVARLLVG